MIKPTKDGVVDAQSTIGTGPYKFVEWVPGDKIVLKANENYHGAGTGAPKYKNILFKPIKSGPARIAALLAKDVDFIDNVPPLNVAKMKKNPTIKLNSGSSNRVIYLHMDQFREDSPHITAIGGGKIKNPLMDVRVRKALSLAINRDAMVSKVMEGIAVKAGQLLPAGFHGVSDKMKPDPYDPEAAKKVISRCWLWKRF